MSGTVPIDQILNANPAWVRQEIDSDLRPLHDSIRRNGIRIPVLLASDFLVIDGARRVRVAQKLRLAEVPVLVTDDWPTILQHITLARNPDDRTYKQMSWLEMHDLQLRILAPLYRKVRSERMLESKRAGTGRRRDERGRVLRPQFAEEVGTALGLGGHRFQALQDMVAALNKGKTLDTELYNQMLSRLLEVEQVEGKIYMATRMLRDMVRRYQRGAKDVAPDKRAAKDQEQTIRGIVNVLEHVSKEATAFTRDVAMNPSVSTDVVAAVLADMNKFRYSMRPFVQKLNEFLAEQNKEREA